MNIRKKVINMAGIINLGELEKAMRPGYYRRKAHEENANKKLGRAKKLIPKTYNLKPKNPKEVKV